jgi:hypothetical protein
MDRKMNIFFAYLLLVPVLYGCLNRSEEKTCVIGKKYIKRFIFNEDNPFERAKYDTVIVIDVQNGWVKYADYSNKDTSFYRSTREEYFLQDSKPCY